jgi:hypothetical protein
MGFQGAPSEVWDSMSDDEKEDVEEEIGNALEVSFQLRRLQC